MLALAILVLTACSTTNSVPPIRSELNDIPLPKGLVYVPEQSAYIESETIKAARVVYHSSFELGSLVLSMQDALEGNGWRLLRSTAFPQHGAVQIYEKGDASLQVRIWEGGAFNSKTYVELSGARMSPRGKATSTASTVSK
jgi:hypothetical protein